jgi:hypothetical protein
MTYTQSRLVKRKGELLLQRRKVTVDTKLAHPAWKFWRWTELTAEYTYGEWEDVEIPEVAI